MPVYTVTQVSRYLRDTLDADANLADLYITGEVSNLSRSGAGHSYFSLKDAEAQLRGVMFRNGGIGAEHLENGASVTVHGRVAFYTARGEVQVYADQVQPEGVGVLHMAFLRLKAKLEEEGLFDPSRKRPIPAMPRRVAAITSRTGSVRHDIQTVIERRFPLIELVMAHTPVQGAAAAPGVVAALRAVNDLGGVDVVILARGGGSLEDLWAFNEEAVARAIHASRVPVVSAIGHETDTTIADLVADLRAPTPSAAAELCVPDRRDLAQRLAEARAALGGELTRLLDSKRDEVGQLALGVQRGAPDIASRRQRLDELSRVAFAAAAREAALMRERLRSRRLQLASLNPANTLDRGYALVERERDSGVVSRTAQVSGGDAIVAHVSDGAFRAVVAEAGHPPSPPARRRRSAKARAAEQMALWES